MGRYGTESEVSAAVVFLLSPGASYITGVTLRVDGASSLCKRMTKLPLLKTNYYFFYYYYDYHHDCDCMLFVMDVWIETHAMKSFLAKKSKVPAYIGWPNSLKSDLPPKVEAQLLSKL
jgi:hypothetical protein